MLEFDTTHNHFRDDLLQEPLSIAHQVKTNNGHVIIPDKPGIGVTPNREFIAQFEIT